MRHLEHPHALQRRTRRSGASNKRQRDEGDDLEEAPVRKSTRKSTRSVPSSKANEVVNNRNGIAQPLKSVASRMDSNIPDEHRDHIGTMVRAELARLKVKAGVERADGAAKSTKTEDDDAADVSIPEKKLVKVEKSGNVFTDDEEDGEIGTSLERTESGTFSGKLSDGEEQISPTAHRSNGKAKANGKALQFDRSPMSDDDVAILDEEAALMKVAMRESVASIAKSNPGDGSKRLYGEDSFILNPADIEGVHPEAMKNNGVRKNKRVTVEECDDDRDDYAVRGSGNKTSGRALLEDDRDEDVQDMVYLEDLEARGLPVPINCEVSNVDDQDPLLRYNHLVPLRGGKEFTSWSQMLGPGLVMPSAWPEQIPSMSMSQLRSVLEFQSHGTFFNPSRADPAEMGHSPSSGSSYLTLPGQAQSFLTLTTCVMTTACNIFRPKEIMGESRRVISGIPHSFEYQRMEASILAAFHENSAAAQIAQDAITFSTAKAGTGSANGSPAKNPSKMFRQVAGTGSSASVFARPRMNLQGIQTVPVLDARGTRFNTSSSLARLDKILPPFRQEVPDGSCAWIGYTVNRYAAQKGISVSFNLLWVVVLGIPE
ncbi:hypothetical protein FIBSPDRAFT_890371 [Athelia psychrophila]|uniref:Uncharacterized protein n=1 Tax=Athelia psychrophila TaxID=1759441 RepID=A0A166L1Y3_9AGAM|nr:hypothetical protein FIBSPDRAFT_890371 [Fibularhizoctonia sp. CBS 109695]